MKNKIMFALDVLTVFLVLAACSSASSRAVPTVVNVTSPPIPTQSRALPTPIPQGQLISYQGLRVTLNQAEITTGYETEYGSKREPTLGGKFLWVEVQLENTGATAQNLPGPEHFSAVYGTSEFKPSYGHRKGYADYSALKASLYQGQKETAWLRFDIPATAELPNLQFVFLPESVEVSFSSPTSGYTWADHPQFFWQCSQ